MKHAAISDWIQNPQLAAAAWILPALLFLSLAANSHSSLTATHSPSPKVQAQADPKRFVQDVLQNEIQAEENDHSLWTYQELKLDHGKKKLLSVCQTKKGNIERLVAVDGTPVSPAEAQAENQRIANLIAHPHQMAQQQKKDQEDTDQAQQLLRMLPQAFLFEYKGTEGNVVRFSFTPNGKFHPSTRPEQVFHHMEGTLLLDGQAKRLAAIDGELTSEVKFGGGWLGHLDKDGTFAVQQQDVGSGYWELTSMRVQMNGRVLFFKTINVQENETYTYLQLVPENTSLQRAAELVKQNESKDSAGIH